MDVIKVGLVFSITNFFINEIDLANSWMSFSCSNLALEDKKKRSIFDPCSNLKFTLNTQPEIQILNEL